MSKIVGSDGTVSTLIDGAWKPIGFHSVTWLDPNPTPTMPATLDITKVRKLAEMTTFSVVYDPVFYEVSHYVYHRLRRAIARGDRRERKQQRRYQHQKRKQ
jgi:hypothetical protein